MRNNFIALILIGLSLIGCASTAPLPATLNIVPPAPDVPLEIAAFSGVWEGKWWGYHESILVVEKIDRNKADVIYSLGLAQGFNPRYSYHTAQVSSGSAIEWTEPNGNKFIFKMDKGLNKIYSMLIEQKTGANYWAYFHRRMVK
jgi:hypothetical protein